MIGTWKAFAAWPMHKRVLAALPVFLLCSWLAMKMSAWLWMEHVVDADPQENQISYDATFLRLNGDFGATNVRLDHFFPDGRPGPSYLADRVVFHPPGLFWVYWNTLRGSKSMPDTFGMTLENARDATTTDQTPGNYTNLPYDQVGCGRPGLLTKSDLSMMGLRDVRRDVTLTLQRKDDQLSTLKVDMLTPGAGELTLDMDVTVERPIPWEMILQRLVTAELRSADLRLADRGFVGLRTAYCSKAAGIPPGRFHAFHMQALDRRLAEGKLAFDAPTLTRYGAFARDGGELHLRGTRLPRLKLMDFATMDTGRKLELIPTALSYNGGQEASFRFLPLEAIAPADAALPAPPVAQAAAVPIVAPSLAAKQASPTVAPTSTAPPPVATAPTRPMAAAAAATTTRGPDAAVLATGTDEIVDYKQLKGREGSHVEVLTSNGTARRGTLIAYSPYMCTLKLDADAGGFTLSVPGDSVVEVRLSPR